MNIGDMEAARAAWKQLVTADGDAAAAALRLTDSVTSVRQAQAAALRDCASFVDSSPDLATDFDLPQDYYAFLARAGMGQRSAYTNKRVTRQVADVIEQLHTPGTFVWLRTDIRNQFPLGRAYAVGRVVCSHLALLTERPTKTAEREFVLMVETSTVTGENRLSEVGIRDITRHFVPDVMMGGVEYPFVVTGREPVAAQVGPLFFQSSGSEHTTRGARGERAEVLRAMCSSGLKLTELGLSEGHASWRREQLVQSLEHVCEDADSLPQGDSLYDGEVLMLPPLCESNKEALGIVTDVLGDREPSRVDPRLQADYATLLHNQAPEAFRAKAA